MSRSKDGHTEKNCYCALCSAKMPKRFTYLYEPELNGWICKECWHKKYDSHQERIEKHKNKKLKICVRCSIAVNTRKSLIWDENLDGYICRPCFVSHGLELKPEQIQAKKDFIEKQKALFPKVLQ